MADYDVIVIGGGPAGLSAALYAARANCKTLVLDSMGFGGKLNMYELLENYPGYTRSSAYILTDYILCQLSELSIDLREYEEILSLNLKERPFSVITSSETITAEKIILATGSLPRKLGIKGEEEFTGFGVSYCATCDGPMAKDKTVAVIGGGNSALEEACYLTKFAKEVYLIHRRNEFRADKVIQDKVLANEKINILYNATPIEISGGNHVETLLLDQQGVAKTLFVDMVFPFVGIIPNNSLFRNQLLLDNNGFIMTDDHMETSIKGIFAAGDVISKALRQVITAAADGATAGFWASKE